ncbi:MAG: sigma 54-interacting transcriptional regulator [bacterium]
MNKKIENKIDLNLEESKEFDILHEIAETLASSFNLSKTLTKIFTILNQKLNIEKTLLILNKETDTYVISESYGFDNLDTELNKYICFKTTQKALSNNKTIIEEINTLELNLSNNKKKTTYFAYPIIMGDEKIGVLHTQLRYKNTNNSHQTNKILSIISLMLGQEIKLNTLKEIETKKLKEETYQLKNELKKKYGIKNMAGTSPKMQEIYNLISQVSHTTTTILIRGESGTGKELIAHAIHHNNHNRHGPFISINCGAIPENLMESELFGHEKGAFTDAYEQKKGKFEAAENGTLFLDELGELSLNLQVKLLRVLQEKEFSPIGSHKTIKTNVRIIAATNENLEQLIEEKKFRKDLYYRLNVFPIYLPPLRERKEDILLLINHFINKFKKETNKDIFGISTECYNILYNYNWPGNIRELENIIERATILCDKNKIQTCHLPTNILGSTTYLTSTNNPTTQKDLKESIKDFEKSLIINALIKSKGNKTNSAKLLNTTVRILNYKIKDLMINWKTYKTK